MTYSNEAVLAALHLALYRQVPWHRRPAVFSLLQRHGLIESVPQRLSVGARPPALDIAQVTARGRAEIARLEREQDRRQWDATRYADYAGEDIPAEGATGR